MISNEQLLEVLKAQITTGLGGLASAQDAEEFIDLAVEQTAILQRIRVETGIRTSMNLDALDLGDPAMIGATEATAPGSDDIIAPTHIRKTLQPIEVISAYDVSFSFLRKNIEGERVNESLNRLFAKRFGKDTVQLIFSGDNSITDTDRTSKLLKILDGFVQQALDDATVHDYTIDASPSYTTEVFPGMLALLPKDYKDQRDQLAFFCSANVYDAYADEIGARATALGDMVLVGKYGEALTYKGIQLLPVWGLDDGRVILTLRQNLAVGFGQEMTVGRDINYRSRLLEVTITAELDCKFVVGDAVVLGATA